MHVNRQLRFQRQGDSFVLVNPKETVKPPSENKKKKWIIGSLIVAGIGLVVLFFIDGGIGLLSAGVVEVMKWTHRHRDSIDTYIQMVSKKPF
jgi:hypothetical protein